MERNDIIKIIPKPTNQDVIVYDVSLKDLAGVDVFKNFNSDLAAYKIKKENYILLDQEIKKYEENLNSIYLYNKSWTEQDYIEILQKEKQTYSTLYGDIKKIENNISILEKKYRTINEQIEIQRKKDVKEIEAKRKDIDNEIDKTENKISNIRSKLIDLNIEADRLQLQYNDADEEISLLNSMQEELLNKEYKCQYCGSIITNGNAKRSIAATLKKKMDKKTKILNSLLINLTKVKRNITNYENELKELREILQNDIEFKKQDYNFYIKKSLKVLELEAARDTIIKKIEELKKQYENEPTTKKEKFNSLKDRISKFEVSLKNLQYVKDNRQNFKEKYNKLNELKQDLIKLNENLKLYKKFIEIYFKIYEKKANDYFGKDFKFKLYKFNNFELEEIFEVFYKDIEYNELNAVFKKEFDNIYNEKISYFL